MCVRRACVLSKARLHGVNCRGGGGAKGGAKGAGGRGAAGGRAAGGKGGGRGGGRGRGRGRGAAAAAAADGGDADGDEGCLGEEGAAAGGGGGAWQGAGPPGYLPEGATRVGEMTQQEQRAVLEVRPSARE